MRILCVGETLIDMICTDHGVSLNEGVHFLKKPGGAPANVAAAISALGGRASLVSRVGKDPFGRYLIENLAKFGVDTRHIITDQDHFTTLAFVSLMENGERDFVFSRGADGHLSLEDMATINIREYGIIHFGSATAFLPGALQHTYWSYLKKAKEEDIFVSFDPNYRHLLYKDRIASFVEQSLHFIRHCQYFKLSEEEALLISGCGNLDSAFDYLTSISEAVFTVTLGEGGTMLRLKNERHIIPSIKINPVDTTGAGDAFVGAVLYQIAASGNAKLNETEHINWKKIVYNANIAGARTCEYMGAMEAYSHLSDQIFKT